jgi:hypothetical protein
MSGFKCAAELCIRRLPAVEHACAVAFAAMGRRALRTSILDGHRPSSTIYRAAFPVCGRRAQGAETRATGRRAPACQGARRRIAVITGARGLYPGAEPSSMTVKWARRPSAVELPLYGSFPGLWPLYTTNASRLTARGRRVSVLLAFCGSRPSIPPHGCRTRLLAVHLLSAPMSTILLLCQSRPRFVARCLAVHRFGKQSWGNTYGHFGRCKAITHAASRSR